MLTEYIEAAMAHAQYEVIEDGTVYGEIPGLQGVWGNAATHAACVDELRDASGTRYLSSMGLTSI
jgi:hypothetical protein